MRDDALAERFSTDRRPQVRGKVRELKGPFDEEHLCYLLDHNGRVLWDGNELYVDLAGPARNHHRAQTRFARATVHHQLAWARVLARWEAKHRPPPVVDDELRCPACGRWFCERCGCACGGYREDDE